MIAQMHTFRRSAALVAFVAAVLASVASPAFAASATEWSSVQIRLVTDQNNQPSVLVGGQLDASSQLPAAVSLAVPTGTNPDWAGQILGGDVSKDPSVQYTKATKGSYDEIDFTLTQSRRGQVEYSAPGAIVDNGGNKQATLVWTAPGAARNVSLSVLVPSGARVSDAGGAQKETVNGADFYTKQFDGVKAGRKLSLKVAYTGGVLPSAQSQSQPPAPAQGGSATVGYTGSGTPPLGLLIPVLAVIIGATFFMLRRVSPAREADEDEAEKDPDDSPDENDDGRAELHAFDPFDDDEQPEQKPAVRKATAKKPASAKAPEKKTAAARKAAPATKSAAKPATGKAAAAKKTAAKEPTKAGPSDGKPRKSA